MIRVVNNYWKEGRGQVTRLVGRGVIDVLPSRDLYAR